MKKIFVKELAEGEFVQTTFLVTSREVRKSRTGEPFLRLTLEDRSGQVEGRVWREPEAMASRVDRDDFVAVRGEVLRFADDLYIEIGDLDRIGDDQVEVADYFAVSRWSPDAMLDQLRELLDREIRSDVLRAFVDALFEDEQVVAKFKTAPAAMSNHHAFRGGLLEHCLSMARDAVLLGGHYRLYYPGLINTDLLIVGVLLHDFAKIWELSYRRNFDYTTPGRLIGHIPMGAKMVARIAARSKRPISEDLQMHLEHLVLSHHGELEFGSPTKPKTPEAFLLHQIDMIDSRMNMLWMERGRTMDPDAGESWSEFRRSLGDRILFRGRNSVDWDLPADVAMEDLSGPGLANGKAAARRAKPHMTLNLFENDEPTE